MPDRTTTIASAFEFSLLLAGLILFWRLRLSPAARRRTVLAALPRWDAPLSDFILFVWLVCAGGFAASLGTGLVLKHYSVERDSLVAVGTAGFQLGILGGIAIFKFFFDHSKTPPPPAPKRNVFTAGVATFLLAMPLVTVVSLVWQALLDLIGLPAEKQDLVRMFLEANSPARLAVMVILACVGAPLTEELVFRAGLFRYARTRLPRWATLLAPACFFAALHQNLASFAPLVALGILFSLAYERTGRIGTSMVAHALFNLNSVVLIIAKVDV
jgi:uncharacterized protein